MDSGVSPVLGRFGARAGSSGDGEAVLPLVTACAITAKYDGAVRYEQAAEELLTQFPWPEQLGHIDCVVPVPLAPEKERKRGFNQSEVLFRSWAERRWPWKDGLQRVRSTQAQWHLDKADRADNVKRAFEVKGSFEVRGKHILLVDDIYTTGTTMEACAYALHKKGAASVTGFVVASGAL